MNTYDYKNEALDSKLCLLRFTKHIWIPIVATLGSAILCAGIYILMHNVLGATREYRMEDEYYIEYAKDENGQEYIYFNQMTWSSLADTDYFVESIMTGMSQTVDREILEGYIDATLLSDTRIVTATVTTPNAELTEEIHDLYREAFLNFAGEYKELERITSIKSDDKAKLVAIDDRSMRVAVMGGVLGLVISLFCMYVYVVVDDSVYLPITLEKRYNVATKVWDKEGNPGDGTEGIMKDNECYCVWVKAGAHNGTRVDKLMTDALKEGKKIENGYLVNPDHMLIKAYYGTQKFPFYHKERS